MQYCAFRYNKKKSSRRSTEYRLENCEPGLDLTDLTDIATYAVSHTKKMLTPNIIFGKEKRNGL